VHGTAWPARVLRGEGGGFNVAYFYFDYFTDGCMTAVECLSEWRQKSVDNCTHHSLDLCRCM
jgi:hypothetical protein